MLKTIGHQKRSASLDIILDALERYPSLPVHFADAYLAAMAAASKTPVFSFDEDFGRFKDIT